MSYKSFPWKSNNKDRTFTSDELTHFFKGRQSDGVATGLNVQPYSGMTVKITDGFASIQGKQFYSETNSSGSLTTLNCGTADSSYSRYVSVFLRKNESQRTIEPYIKIGSPSASPIIPEIERTSDIYEIRLANILIPKGVITITSDMIHSTIAENECGMSINQPASVDTSAFSGELNSWLELFKSAKESEFNEWFEDLQTILNENAAANLYNAIQNKTSIVICTADNQPPYSEGQIIGVIEE